MEARLDFADEGDVADAGALTSLADDCAAVAADMARALDKPAADRLKDGVRIVIAGPPNAGKSTLFNWLVGREAAIVSPIAGTTRDIIEASIAIRGIPMLLSDSAGLRTSEDQIEQLGIGRAEALIAASDIILWLGASDKKPIVDGIVLQIHPKADLDHHAVCAGFRLSAVSGEGMDQLVDALCAAASVYLPMPSDYALSQRQKAVLQRTVESVRAAGLLHDEILIGECLRVALTTLDELTGRATTDAVLDELFSGFCVGK